MDNAVATGRKVVLRDKRLEDASQDYAWRADEELARLDATSPLRMDFQEYMRLYQDELRHPTPWSKRFAIDTLEGKHIGNCMCYDINTVDREAELGIVIGDQAYWSNGYGYDAVVTLVDHVFATVPLERVYLHTLDWNIRARRCFTKCGFREVRPVHRAGMKFIYMELTRQQWQEIRQEKTNGRAAVREGASG